MKIEEEAHFAYLMTGSTTLSERILGLLEMEREEVELPFQFILAKVRDLQGRGRRNSFEELDDRLILNFDDVPRETNPFLLAIVQRRCGVAVLGYLTPPSRAAFILAFVFGYSSKETADLLGIRESQVQVRMTRSHRKVEDYLSPRCSHIDPQNPCSCEERYWLANRHKFLQYETADGALYKPGRVFPFTRLFQIKPPHLRRISDANLPMSASDGGRGLVFGSLRGVREETSGPPGGGRPELFQKGSDVLQGSIKNPQ